MTTTTDNLRREIRLGQIRLDSDLNPLSPAARAEIEAVMAVAAIGLFLMAYGA